MHRHGCIVSRIVGPSAGLLNLLRCRLSFSATHLSRLKQGSDSVPGKRWVHRDGIGHLKVWGCYVRYIFLVFLFLMATQKIDATQKGVHLKLVTKQHFKSGSTI